MNNPDDFFLFVGDFNITQASWILEQGLNRLAIDECSDNKVFLIRDFLNYTDFVQYNWCKNASGKILDLVLSNTNCSVSNCADPLTPEDSHHKSLEISVGLPQFIFHKDKIRRVRNFHKANYSQICEKLNEIDWSIMLTMNTEHATEFFYSKINDIIDTHVPVIIMNCNNNHPPWYTQALIKIGKEKLKYHKRWKTYNNSLDHIA